MTRTVGSPIKSIEQFLACAYRGSYPSILSKRAPGKAGKSGGASAEIISLACCRKRNRLLYRRTPHAGRQRRDDTGPGRVYSGRDMAAGVDRQG